MNVIERANEDIAKAYDQLESSGRVVETVATECEERRAAGWETREWQLPPAEPVKNKATDQADAQTHKASLGYIERRIQENMSDMSKAVGEAVSAIVAKRLAEEREKIKREGRDDIMSQLIEMLGRPGGDRAPIWKSFSQILSAIYLP